jgi:hypothetical protein
MIIMNYPIPTLGILRLSNIASEQDPHSLFHVHMFLRPKDTHSTLPILGTQGDHSRQHIGMSFYSMDFDSPWPILATQGDLYRQQLSIMLFYPMGNDLL